MSHAGPPAEPPPGPGQDGAGEGASGQEPYNPYPDNWNSPGRSSTPQSESPYARPDPYPQATSPYAQADPYGQPQPYAAPAQPGAHANPYAGPETAKPTFIYAGFAGWWARVAAFLIDYFIYAVSGAPAWLGEYLLFANSTTTTNAQGVKTVHYHQTAATAVLFVLAVITVVAVFVWNICIRQGRTGATVGKSVLAIRLVNSDLQPIGGGWSCLRFFLHILDYLPCCLGFLWPIWDSRKQTFADKIMGSFVIRATEPQAQPYLPPPPSRTY